MPIGAAQVSCESPPFSLTSPRRTLGLRLAADGKVVCMGPTAGGDLVTVTPYRDGPYLIRGPFRMLDQEGKEITIRRPTIALCRCGKSRMRPLCDGTHKTIGFRAPSGAEAWPATEACAPEVPAQTSSPSPTGSTKDHPPSEASTSRSARGLDDAALAPAGPHRLLPVLSRVREARAKLERALVPPMPAHAYLDLALAEPLLQAADRLLEWIVAGTLTPHTFDRPVANGYTLTRRDGLEACRDAAEAALRSMPTAPDDRRLRQLRFLLQHAAEALRA